jgi:hypothetical protein
MWPTKRLQELSDACEDARVDLARAMTDPKDTVELNRARAELTRLEQLVGAFTAAGGPRLYGSGCSGNATGYRDLHGHGETGVIDPVYSGPKDYPVTERLGSEHTYQEVTAQYPEASISGTRREPFWGGDDKLPAFDHSQQRRR